MTWQGQVHRVHSWGFLLFRVVSFGLDERVDVEPGAQEERLLRGQVEGESSTESVPERAAKEERVEEL
jgi:hypothetical protein